jgi:hypothetical protein
LYQRSTDQTRLAHQPRHALPAYSLDAVAQESSGSHHDSVGRVDIVYPNRDPAQFQDDGCFAQMSGNGS